ncbi:response regulator [Dyadobacter fanqingshengii]|uniref:Response regulator n=1 Tax=Dyadobacter fanqingshengii TaxID=2906443 RepID=A0A9X1P9W4_9BACT|nr:response regulator [Dyadobacter fanqingshengii]MCF0040682.1 response regulator [Dyadobacter fanqingshengii]USJ37580.1 response regulator [Dyadobacter fanqingshengii]
MNKKKVLIIDDDARNIFALKATLKAKSYDCISCSGATEALDLLRTGETVDAILIDMMMPEMDGYDAIPLIKKIDSRQNTPVYAVTAQAMVGDREKCLRAGADEYISKPIDVEKLLQLLKDI